MLPAQPPPVTPAANPTPDKPRRIILDVDPGIDDAMAVLLALRSPELRIEAITVVAGNVVVDQGAENALKLVELAGRADVIVAKGEKHPLQKKLRTAEAIHGKNGLGGVQLPPPKKQLDPRRAADLIIELVNANPGQITLVPVGPLTNIAMAFIKEPGIRRRIPGIILMGGSIVGGNATPAAEANFDSDPEAAHIVFESGIPIVMVDLGATRQARFDRSHLATLAKSDSPIARFVAAIAEPYIAFAESRGAPGASLHDPLAVGIAIDKTLAATLTPMHIAVETKGQFTRGATVANRSLEVERLEDVGDRYVIAGFEKVKPNADVPVVVDGDRFLRMFITRLSR